MKYIYSLISIFFISIHVVFSQPSLSLIQAIEIGLEKNFSILIQNKNIELAKSRNSKGQAGLLPALSLNINENNNLNIVDNPASFLQGTTISNSLSPNIALTWILFDGFRGKITKKRLNDIERETLGNAEIVVQNTIQSIILGYYSVVLEKNRLEVLKNILKSSREKYYYGYAKKELGVLGTVDILTDQSAYLTDSINYKNQAINMNTILKNFNVLLVSDNINQDYIFTDGLIINHQVFDKKSFYQEVISNNSNLKKEYLTQKILQQDIRLAQASLYPTVNFNAGYTYIVNRQDLTNATFIGDNEAPTQPILSTNQNIAANFTLTYNLFNGGRIKSAIKNAMIQEDIQNLTIEDMKINITRDIYQNLDTYAYRREIKQVTQKASEVARLNLNINQERYKTGLINSFDYRSIQINYLSAALVDLQATYNLIESYINLMRLSGKIVDYQQ